MEGLGSRQSRASSRYSSSPSAPVFNGPVRKWKKQWVSSRSNNQHNGNSRNDGPPLLLCRWTPLSATASSTAEEPRKRFRYAPVVPIEKGKSEGKEKADNEARTSESISGRNMASVVEIPGRGDVSLEDAQELNDDRMDSILGGA